MQNNQFNQFLVYGLFRYPVFANIRPLLDAGVQFDIGPAHAGFPAAGCRKSSQCRIFDRKPATRKGRISGRINEYPAGYRRSESGYPTRYQKRLDIRPIIRPSDASDSVCADIKARDREKI